MVRENITPIEQDADKLMKELFAKGLITDKPYDHPIKFVAFDPVARLRAHREVRRVHGRPGLCPVGGHLSDHGQVL